MEKKNVVSIEDRIPKLKQERKKKANRRLIFYLSVFFVLIAIIVYLQSPLSHVRTVKVTGNSMVSDEEVIKQTSLNQDTNIWMINDAQIVKSVSENPAVESAEVTRKLPWTVHIKLNEYEHVGYIKNKGNFFPILGNSEVLTEVKQETINGDAPLILGFSDKDYLKEMTQELEKLPVSILRLISEVHWDPEDGNQNKIKLYMNEGYIVDGTIRNFAEKMKVYPSIVSQLDPDKKGIIHIGVGAYFEEFNKPVEEEAASDEEINDTEN
ncbi:cell division protein FtsQ/DivIB [Virgibacillus kekensis]|uniref:Cell division protein DivIB n=1 Tax=Virgibacillus kekensis TaxID=202261 RepID=A0ABV9DDZ6_9BACI